MSMSRAMPMRMNAFFTAAPAAVSWNATTIARAYITVAQKSGTIDCVKFLKRSAAGNGAIAAARIETVSASNPTGTLFATGADGSLSLDATTGVKSIPLNTPPTVTVGDIIATILYFTDVTGTPSIAGTIATPYSLPAISSGLPGLRNNAAFSVGSASGWTNGTANTICSFAALYNDGIPLIGGVVPLDTAVTNTTVPTSGANSYLGLKGGFDYDCDLEFIQWCGRTDGSVHWEVYDASNNLLGTSNTLANGVLTTTVANTVVARFGTPIALTAGQSYRLIERSVSGAYNAQTSLGLMDATMLAALFGANWCRTSSADGTTWTDDTTGICPGILPFITPKSSSGSSRIAHPMFSQVIG